MGWANCFMRLSGPASYSISPSSQLHLSEPAKVKLKSSQTGWLLSSKVRQQMRSRRPDLG